MALAQLALPPQVPYHPRVFYTALGVQIGENFNVSTLLSSCAYTERC